jgi:hypothetical protein
VLFDSKPETRYEKQLENVDHLVLHTIQDKHNIMITKKELSLILQALWEWRVID